MKKIISFTVMCLTTVSAIAADVSPDRRTMASGWSNTTRATASKNQIMAGSLITANKSSIKTEALAVPPVVMVPKPIDTREKEKKACMSNNIGAGNTFVWASKYSNTSNYTSMIEDLDMPENNVCFVKIELKSSDAKINVSDIKPVYYEMGRTITCGAWADDGRIKDRILDAKKSGRTWGTVAGAVGGAGVGVGAMELFGNQLIGGKVMGQKDKKLDRNDRIRSQMIVMSEKKDSRYDELKRDLTILQQECERKDASGASIWTETTRPAECDSIDYNGLLSI